MKYTYTLFVSLFILSSCGSGDCAYTHDAKEWSEKWTEDEEIVFEGERYNRDNNWILVRKFNGKEITGSYCSFDTRGRQTRKENYLNGRLNGLVLVFDKYKGIVEDTVTYENGYKEGRDVAYRWSDSLSKLIPAHITTYSKNLRNGVYIKYWSGSSAAELQIHTKGNYKNDLPEGYWETFHSNGEVESKRTYKDGNLCGLLKVYGEDGRIISVDEYVESENGTMVNNKWQWTYASFGNDVWCQVKKDGKYTYVSFDREGKVRSDQEYNRAHKNLVHYDFDGYSDWIVEGYSY